MIPVFKPDLGKEELQAIEKIFNSGWIGLGPKTQEFENAFAEYIGSEYAIGVNSATAGLELALRVLNIGPEDEVLVPSMTFVTPALVCLYVGAKPVFVDCAEDDLCIDVQDARRKVTSHTKAIIPVHFGGHACQMDEISELATEFDLKIIEDCAHGAGGEYRSKKLGSFGDMGVFSFHAVKNLATGDGGMITFNNENYSDRFKKLRWLGIDKDTWNRSHGKSYSWKYSVDTLGYKCHMNDITAVIGLEQLKKLDKANGKRRELAEQYNRQLKKFDWLKTPVEKEYAKSAFHNYVIKTEYRDRLHEYLAQMNISTGVHYEPINHHKVFGEDVSETPVAERVWTKLLTLPLYPSMTDREFETIINAIEKFSISI